MTDDSLDNSLNDSARQIGDHDGNSSHADDSSASRHHPELPDHEGQASEDGESMDAPTLQADAALALAKQFQKARRAGIADAAPLPLVKQGFRHRRQWAGK